MSKTPLGKHIEDKSVTGREDDVKETIRQEEGEKCICQSSQLLKRFVRI